MCESKIKCKKTTVHFFRFFLYSERAFDNPSEDVWGVREDVCSDFFSNLIHPQTSFENERAPSIKKQTLYFLRSWLPHITRDFGNLVCFSQARFHKKYKKCCFSLLLSAYCSREIAEENKTSISLFWKLFIFLKSFSKGIK